MTMRFLASSWNFVQVGAKLHPVVQVLVYTLPVAAYTMLPALPPGLVAFFHRNILTQSILFLLCVQVPSLMTGKLFYVDIGWPVGLSLIALNSLLMGDGMPLRRYIVCSCMLLHGSRMALGAVYLFGKRSNWTFRLPIDLNRYRYAKRTWILEKGMPENLWWIKAQQEVSMQGFMNMCFLCLPCALAAFNPAPKVRFSEAFGLCLWLLSYAFENISDLQKSNFMAEVKRSRLEHKLTEKIRGANENDECSAPVLGFSRWTKKYWLWGLVRHPNYLGEWGCWCAWTIIGLSQIDIIPQPARVIFMVALLMLPILLYDCLVYWTGAAPSEFYSTRRRPVYRDYQILVPCIFPKFVGVGQHCIKGWPSAGSGSGS